MAAILAAALTACGSSGGANAPRNGTTSDAPRTTTTFTPAPAAPKGSPDVDYYGY